MAYFIHKERFQSSLLIGIQVGHGVVTDIAIKTKM
jgi:hypothetical protein